MAEPVVQSHGVTDVFTPCEPVDTRPDERITPSVATIAPSNSHSVSPPILSLPNQSSVSSQSTQPSVVLPTLFSAQSVTYRGVYHHWFFRKQIEGKVLWTPFSMSDSLALEETFTSPTISPNTKVATDGGRYDVEVLRRRRIAVYWEEEPSEVRRCSWFVKGSLDSRYAPYDENIATLLEEEYKIAATTNEWNRHINLPGDGEVIILHGPNAIAHHMRSSSPDAWGNIPQVQQKPRVVKRGLDEFDISEGEPEKIDHLLFLVHGVGQYCDMKFRPVIEVVDDFRSISLQLLQSHFKGATEAGLANRIEVLPISWHKALHSEDMDKKLHNITLKSIPRLRHFTNDTLLDILFYTSPVFCETIVQAVGNEINRLYSLFLSRNPYFQGNVSLGGHSLGSLILFDMLCNQSLLSAPSPLHDQLLSPHNLKPEEEEMRSLGCMKAQKARLNHGLSYLTIGTSGTGQPFISYPQLLFKPKAFFALGSPIGMFLTVRGIDFLGEDFVLPTCSSFFNIFHPFDPVAYRIEPLIVKGFSKYPPVLIPHHKGRKRMHLELKDTLEHVGAALKQRLLDSVRNTWNTVHLAIFHRSDETQGIEEEVTKVIEDEINKQPLSDTIEGLDESEPGKNVTIGSLNGGCRIDYVLQEAPLESFNEYIFAMSSHVCYWESEDTLLMILKEVYHSVGVAPDSQVSQQILPFETGDGGNSVLVNNPAPSVPNFVSLNTSNHILGMDPTAPISENLGVGPPPLSGFVRK